MGRGSVVHGNEGLLFVAVQAAGRPAEVVALPTGGWCAVRRRDDTAVRRRGRRRRQVGERLAPKLEEAASELLREAVLNSRGELFRSLVK